MKTNETPVRKTYPGGTAAQALFDAMFPGRAPKTDTRTPADVAADKAAGWPIRCWGAES